MEPPFLDFTISGENWMVDIKPWVPILNSYSSDLRNPDITDYMGYGRVVFAFSSGQHVFSVMLRNVLESGFKYGAMELNYSFPIHGMLRGYVEYFRGYGQSLVEYNRYTNSLGVGFIIGDWI